MPDLSVLSNIWEYIHLLFYKKCHAPVVPSMIAFTHKTHKIIQHLRNPRHVFASVSDNKV